MLLRRSSMLRLILAKRQALAIRAPHREALVWAGEIPVHTFPIRLRACARAKYVSKVVLSRLESFAGILPVHS